MNHLTDKLSIVAVLASIVFTLSSCYENQEGCLDILATNYNVVADEDCEDCCTYPSLILSLNQINGDTTFRLGDTIVNDIGKEVRLLKIVYFLSEFGITIEGDVLSTLDTMRATKSDLDTFLVRNDILVFSRAKANYEIGTIAERGLASSLTFQTGIPFELEGAEFVDGVSNDVVRNVDSLRSEDNNYTIQRLLLSRGLDFADTITFDVPAAFGGELVTLELDTSYIAGVDKEVDITVDYQKLFKNIDFDTDSDDKIREDLAANMAEIFSVE